MFITPRIVTMDNSVKTSAAHSVVYLCIAVNATVDIIRSKIIDNVIFRPGCEKHEKKAFISLGNTVLKCQTRHVLLKAASGEGRRR